MTSPYYWLTKLEVIAIHDDIIKDYGGLLGILNQGTLESSLHRPQQLAYYEPHSSLFDLAASYGYGFVKNHCFVDGNKRTAFVVMATFLQRNGCQLVASEVEAVELMVALAKGEISQSELTAWLRSNVIALD